MRNIYEYYWFKFSLANVFVKGGKYLNSRSISVVVVVLVVTFTGKLAFLILIESIVVVRLILFFSSLRRS